MASFGHIFLIFLRLGCTSFGGPVAHLGFFREEFVVRRKWLSEAAFADLVGLCQFLPGPASSQVGLGLGLMRGGTPGAFAAWLGFTMPSALIMLAFAYGLATAGDIAGAGWLHGLKLVAVAVVAQAALGMWRGLIIDRARATIATVALIIMLASPFAAMQLAVIFLAGLVGFILFRNETAPAEEGALVVPVNREVATGCLLLFFLILTGLPVILQSIEDPVPWITLFDAFYRSGSLVFGGGHVVLPLLEGEVVETGWVAEDTFLAGYGAAQAIPGPLFTLSAFLGGVETLWRGGWAGAAVCLVGIFVPAFLLVFGALPYWADLRRSPRARAALSGVNAGVVGLILSALYDPVFSRAVTGPMDLAVVGLALLALASWRLPPWLVVIAGAALGEAIVRF